MNNLKIYIAHVMIDRNKIKYNETILNLIPISKPLKFLNIYSISWKNNSVKPSPDGVKGKKLPNKLTDTIRAFCTSSKFDISEIKKIIATRLTKWLVNERQKTLKNNFLKISEKLIFFEIFLNIIIDESIKNKNKQKLNIIIFEIFSNL